MKTLTAYIVEKMVFNKKNVNKGNNFDLEIKPFEEAYDLLFNYGSIEDVFFSKDDKEEIFFIDKDGQEQSLVYDDIDKKDKTYFVGVLICHFLDNKDMYKKLNYNIDYTLNFIKDYIYEDLKKYEFNDTDCYDQNQYDGVYGLLNSKNTQLDYTVLLDIDPDVEVEPYHPGDYWTPPEGGDINVVFNTEINDLQLEIKDSYYEGNQVEKIFDLLELSKDELKKLSDLGGKMYDLIDEDNWIDKYGEQYT